MRQFYTAVLDTFHELQPNYATEPFEAAWASEALFFVRAESVEPGSGPVGFAIEVSPDGITWVEEGSTFELTPVSKLAFVKVRHFGGWLRLRHVDGSPDGYRATVYLVLKE